MLMSIKHQQNSWSAIKFCWGFGGWQVNTAECLSEKCCQVSVICGKLV